MWTRVQMNHWSYSMASSAVTHYDRHSLCAHEREIFTCSTNMSLTCFFPLLRCAFFRVNDDVTYVIWHREILACSSFSGFTWNIFLTEYELPTFQGVYQLSTLYIPHCLIKINICLIQTSYMTQCMLERKKFQAFV